MLADEVHLEDGTDIVARVRLQCQLCAGSARSVGLGQFEEGDEFGEYETARYRKVRDETLDIALNLRDEFHRDVALHCVFNMCMKAADFQFANVIVKAFTTEVIQDVVVAEYRDFFILNDRDGRLHPSAKAPLAP